MKTVLPRPRTSTPFDLDTLGRLFCGEEDTSFLLDLGVDIGEYGEDDEI